MNAYFVDYFFAASSANQKGIALQEYCRRYHRMLIVDSNIDDLRSLIAEHVRQIDAANPRTLPLQVSSGEFRDSAFIHVSVKDRPDTDIVRLGLTRVKSQTTGEGLASRLRQLKQNGGEA